MRRDMDLVRQIAFAIEDTSGGIVSERIVIDGYSSEQIAYHCELMHESGLINCIDDTCLGSPYRKFHINRLTSAGHDFTDAARNDSLWKKQVQQLHRKLAESQLTFSCSI